MKYEEPREGMPITRNMDGKLVRLDNLNQATQKRIEMLVEMNEARQRLESAADWNGMLKLAQMYEERNMLTMAAMIRKEIEAHGAKATVSTSPNDTRAGRKKKRNLPTFADSVHAGTTATDSRPVPAVTGTRPRKKVRTDPNHSLQR